MTIERPTHKPNLKAGDTGEKMEDCSDLEQAKAELYDAAVKLEATLQHEPESSVDSGLLKQLAEIKSFIIENKFQSLMIAGGIVIALIAIYLMFKVPSYPGVKGVDWDFGAWAHYYSRNSGDLVWRYVEDVAKAVENETRGEYLIRNGSKITATQIKNIEIDRIRYLMAGYFASGLSMLALFTGFKSLIENVKQAKKPLRNS